MRFVAWPLSLLWESRELPGYSKSENYHRVKNNGSAKFPLIYGSTLHLWVTFHRFEPEAHPGWAWGSLMHSSQAVVQWEPWGDWDAAGSHSSGSLISDLMQSAVSPRSTWAWFTLHRLLQVDPRQAGNFQLAWGSQIGISDNSDHSFLQVILSTFTVQGEDKLTRVPG